MSNGRVLTDEEKGWVKEEGMNPDLYTTLFSNGDELHLRNLVTGSDCIIYWGLAHRRKAAAQ